MRRAIIRCCAYLHSHYLAMLIYARVQPIKHVWWFDAGCGEGLPYPEPFRLYLYICEFCQRLYSRGWGVGIGEWTGGSVEVMQLYLDFQCHAECMPIEHIYMCEQSYILYRRICIYVGGDECGLLFYVEPNVEQTI